MPQKLWQASNFRIEIGGLPAAYFKSVEGLSVEVDVVNYQTKWPNLVLKQGFSPSRDPYSQKVNPGAATNMKAAGRLVLHGFVLDERNKHLLQHWVNPGAPRIATPLGLIVVSDNSGRTVSRYNFYEAWPAKWYVPAGTNGKSVELAVGRLVRL